MQKLLYRKCTNKLLIIVYCISVIACNQKFDIEFERKKTNDLYAKEIEKSQTEGKLNLTLKILDSIYRQISNPNAYDKQHYYYSCCWMNHSMGKYDLANKYADSCIAILNLFKDKESIAIENSSILLEKGLILIKQGNTNLAYEQFFKAKQAIEFLSDTCLRINPLHSYGLVLYKQKEYESAKEAFIIELKLLNKCYPDNQYLQYGRKQNVLGNIGLCYSKLNKTDSARYFYFEAIEVVEKQSSITEPNLRQIRYKSSLGVIYGNIAKTYTTSNPDSAIILYKSAIQYNASGTPELGDAQLCMFQLANVQLQQKKYSDAFATLGGLRKSLDTSKNNEAELGYREVVYKYYTQMKQHEKALLAHQNFVSLRDSIYQQELGINTTNINKELRDKEQQLQIAVLQKDNELSKLYMWIFAISCIVAAAIAFIINRNFRKTKQLNQQVNSQKIALEKANKDKDRILNVVAHDLRNPIGAIANFLYVAQVKYEHCEDEEHILKTSQQAAVHSLTLINDLLEINQMQEGNLVLNKTKVDIKQLAELSIDYLRYKAIAKQQTILLNVVGENFNVNADAEKLQRVITNLIDNAVKFSYIDKEVIVNIKQLENQLEISITDSGVGIPPQIIEQLFTASITVKRKGTNNEKSNGLGLSICKQIVEAHSGIIDVDSTEGMGSVFTIRLPIGV